MSEAEILNAPSCRALFESKKDGDRFTREEMMGACGYLNGQPDIAILVTERAIPGPLFSISQTEPQLGEELVLLSYSPSCGGDSGGIHYRRNAPNTIVGVHTGRSHEDQLTFKIGKKHIAFPAHIARGTNVTKPEVRAWLVTEARDFGIEICGINTPCP